MPEPLPLSSQRLRLGISSCLLGQRVRYDGGDKRAPLLAEVVGSQVEWVPVCPEVEAGFGTPRPPMILRRAAGGPRLWIPSTGQDLTEPMRRLARERVAALGQAGLHGYVLKSRSPSCGLRSVAVHDEAGERVATGSGLFAAALCRHLPRLPVAEESELEDPAALTQFLRRAYFFRRWQQRAEPLESFHRRHRALLLASGAAATRRLDRTLAAAGGVETHELVEHYALQAMRILRRVPSRRCHARNLGWVVGQLVAEVDDRQRRANVDGYRAYARGELAWSEIAGVLRRSAERAGNEVVLSSQYLFPESGEWELLVRLDRLQPPECAPVN
jgi:uncharacterized protein YbbK (DUF523 family)/uncharacterized protein YbgA (DUF1722 family)